MQYLRVILCYTYLSVDLQIHYCLYKEREKENINKLYGCQRYKNTTPNIL